MVSIVHSMPLYQIYQYHYLLFELFSAVILPEMMNNTVCMSLSSIYTYLTTNCSLS